MSAGINDKTSIAKNYAYRLWRLLMPYWFTLITVNVIYFIIFRKFYYINLFFFLGDVIPVLDIVGLPYEMFNGVFWYMNFTLFLVLIMPFIYELSKRFNVIPLILIMALYRLIPTVIDSPYGGRYASYLFAAGLGVLFQIYKVFDRILERFKSFSIINKIICLIGLLLCAALCPYAGLVFKTGAVFGVMPMLFTAGGLAVILIGYLFVSHHIIAKPLTFLGQFSYDIFLIHVMVYRNAVVILRPLRYVILQYIAAVCLCFLAAYVLHLLKKYTGWLKLITVVSNKIKAAGSD